jgi:hypothetical protein
MQQRRIEDNNFDVQLSTARSPFGQKIVPIFWPTGKTLVFFGKKGFFCTQADNLNFATCTQAYNLNFATCARAHNLNFATCAQAHNLNFATCTQAHKR